jgi:DNA ligase-1
MQPKLDGVRCLAFWKEDSVVLQSRGNKIYHVPEISESLSTLLKDKLKEGLILDGEIYGHGMTFEEVVSAVKANPKKREEKRAWIDKLALHVYDVVCDKGWLLRKLILTELQDSIKANPRLEFVDNTAVGSEELVKATTADYIASGYEGGIIRIHGLEGYEVGHRSKNLLKVKAFTDSEYRITGYCSGVGRAKDCVIYECVTEDGKPFRVVPKGSLEKRKEWYTNAHLSIGEYLKVKYFELTGDGIPRFPVGVGIRPKEDM